MSIRSAARQNRLRYGIVIALLAYALSLVASQHVIAEVGTPMEASTMQPQVFNDGLTVSEGEVVNGDAVVYQGDTIIERGGEIRGNLVIYRGDLSVLAGGTIAGDVTSFSGNISVEGEVGGSINAHSGDVRIGESALISGDVAVISGSVTQVPGSQTRGSLLRGPNLKLNTPPPIPPTPTERGIPEPKASDSPPSLWMWGGAVLIVILVSAGGYWFFRARSRPTAVKPQETTSAQKKCLICGSWARPGAQYCAKCGATLPEG